MRGIGRKASFLCVMAVAATALVGAAYTLWYENLEATVTVESGELDARIFCGPTVDNENPTWDDTHPGYPEAVPLKNVASTPLQQANGPYLYQISVSNVYPGYMLDCELHISNEGTVPWHLETEVIEVWKNGVLLYSGTCPAPDPFNPGACTAGDISPTNPNGFPIYVELIDQRGCQRHFPNDIIGSLFVGVNQSAQEGMEYNIKLKFQVNQWNESMWDNCLDVRDGFTSPVLPPGISVP